MCRGRGAGRVRPCCGLVGISPAVVSVIAGELCVCVHACLQKERCVLLNYVYAPLCLGSVPELAGLDKVCFGGVCAPACPVE